MKEFKVESNADGLGLAKGMLAIDSSDVGDYQGQTVVLLNDDVNKSVHIYIIGYGSCGGCDWFEDFYNREPTYKDCLEAWQYEKPLYIYPLIEFIAKSPKELYELLLDKEGGYQSMTDEYGWTIESAKQLLDKATDLASESPTSKKASPLTDKEG